MNPLDRNNTFEAKFWNDRYLNKDTSWDLGSTTPIFQHWSKSLKNKKKILVPGAGNGYDALYLAKLGHDVYALDFSEQSIENIKLKAKESKININTIYDNFFNLDSKLNGYFDIVLEYTFFCAIPISKRKEYIKKSYELLNIEGLFIGILLPLDKKISDSGPPFGIELENTLNDFSKYFVINNVEQSDLSVKPRANREVFVKMSRK